MAWVDSVRHRPDFGHRSTGPVSLLDIISFYSRHNGPAAHYETDATDAVSTRRPSVPAPVYRPTVASETLRRCEPTHFHWTSTSASASARPRPSLHPAAVDNMIISSLVSNRFLFTTTSIVKHAENAKNWEMLTTPCRKNRTSKTYWDRSIKMDSVMRHRSSRIGGALNQLLIMIYYLHQNKSAINDCYRRHRCSIAHLFS